MDLHKAPAGLVLTSGFGLALDTQYKPTEYLSPPTFSLRNTSPVQFTKLALAQEEANEEHHPEVGTESPGAVLITWLMRQRWGAHYNSTSSQDTNTAQCDLSADTGTALLVHHPNGIFQCRKPSRKGTEQRREGEPARQGKQSPENHGIVFFGKDL